MFAGGVGYKLFETHPNVSKAEAQQTRTKQMLRTIEHLRGEVEARDARRQGEVGPSKRR